MEDRLKGSESSGPLRPCGIRTEFADPLNYLMERFSLIFRLDRFRAHSHMLPLVVNRPNEGHRSALIMADLPTLSWPLCRRVAATGAMSGPQTSGLHSM